jgi:ferritin-like metal-binding protein YciE
MFKSPSKQTDIPLDPTETGRVGFQEEVSGARFQSAKQNSKRDDVVAWLRDAHAMETSHIENLHHLVRISKEYPGLQAHFEDHIAVSTRQRDEIDRELKRLGANRSVVKDWGMRLTAQLQPLVGKFARGHAEKLSLGARL